MTSFFFAESNRFATVFGVDFARHVNRELELTIPLSPHVSWGDIYSVIQHPCTALWLDRECVIVPLGLGGLLRQRYYFRVSLISGSDRGFELYQVSGTTEPGAPLPALQYIIDRITNDECLSILVIRPYDFPDSTKTLDISPACFLNLLQNNRLHGEKVCSVRLDGISLTAEQTALLFTHDARPVFIDLWHCRFHGPTLLQLGSALRREQTHVLGRGSYLTITLHDTEIGSISFGELTALLSIPHLRSFSPSSVSEISYEKIKKLAAALAANIISRLGTCGAVEWEREEEESAWINLWKAIEEHPSLKEVRLKKSNLLSLQKGLCQQSWWQPIAAAVLVNPRLVHVNLCDRLRTYDCTWKTKLEEYVEPLLERNRYRPKIAALCCTDPSEASVLLGQAIVAVAGKKNAKGRREIHRMLLDQLVLSGYDFGVRVGRVLAEERPKWFWLFQICFCYSEYQDRTVND